MTSKKYTRFDPNMSNNNVIDVGASYVIKCFFPSTADQREEGSSFTRIMYCELGKYFEHQHENPSSTLKSLFPSLAKIVQSLAIFDSEHLWTSKPNRPYSFTNKSI
jgi:hypothetical protein